MFYCQPPRAILFLATVSNREAGKYLTVISPQDFIRSCTHETDQNYAQFFHSEGETDLQSQPPTLLVFTSQRRRQSRKLHDNNRPSHNHREPATLTLFLPPGLVLPPSSLDLINGKLSFLITAEGIPLYSGILPNLLCNMRIKVRLEEPSRQKKMCISGLPKLNDMLKSLMT